MIRSEDANALRSTVQVPPSQQNTVPQPPSRRKALLLTGGFSCLILLLLQLWRPYYFLRDDSLIYWLPIVNTMGNRLLHGQSPAINPYLFEGYNLLRDPTCLSLWNPLVLGLSLLSNTRFYLTIVDLFCSFNLLLSSLCFTFLLCRLREIKSLALSDGRIIFLSLSFTFSMYALSIGACWLMFLGNPVALSLFMLGLLTERRMASIGIIAGGMVYGTLLAHMSPLLYTLFFFSLFAVGLCWANRSWQPLQCWCGGILLALLLLAPILWPAVQGFAGSSRSVPYDLTLLTKNNLPLAAIPLAFFTGYMGVFLGAALGLFSIHYIYGLSACAASFAFFNALPGAKRLSRLEITVGVVALVVALFLVRPYWLSLVVSHVPLFRSLRWPFRETFILLFFIHFWMALRPVTMSPRAAFWTNAAGAAVFAVSLTIIHPWSFSPMRPDRELLLSGKAQAYWAALKPSFGPDDRLITIADRNFTEKHHDEIPYVLLGAFNYPALFEVKALGGYTAQGLSSSKQGGDKPYFLGSIYSSDVGKRMLAKNAHLKALRLVTVQPPRIDLCDASGCRTLALPSFEPVRPSANH